MESIGNVFARQRDLLVPEDTAGVDVDVVGAGSLGGAIVVALAKTGFGIRSRITVTDFDRCELHNLPAQWFRATDVALSRAKVAALADMLAFVCERDVETVEARFTGAEERRIGPVVVLAVDSFAERRRVWSNLARRDDVRLLVDARAGGEVVEVWALDLGAPDRDAARAAFAASLEEAPSEEPCTRRSVFYAVLGAGAVVASVVRGWVRGERPIRRVTADWGRFWVDRESGGAEFGASGPNLPAPTSERR
jgi:molybdopterin/thiamine biosynthesis adenylyltransferase